MFIIWGGGVSIRGKGLVISVIFCPATARSYTIAGDPISLHENGSKSTHEPLGCLNIGHVPIYGRPFWVNYLLAEGKQFEPNMKAGTFKKSFLEKK